MPVSAVSGWMIRGRLSMDPMGRGEGQYSGEVKGNISGGEGQYRKGNIRALGGQYLEHTFLAMYQRFIVLLTPAKRQYFGHYFDQKGQYLGIIFSS